MFVSLAVSVGHIWVMQLSEEGGEAQVLPSPQLSSHSSLVHTRGMCLLLHAAAETSRSHVRATTLRHTPEAPPFRIILHHESYMMQSKVRYFKEHFNKLPPLCVIHEGLSYTVQFVQSESLTPQMK